MSGPTWDRASTLKLIELYKRNELLVNPKHPFYKNRQRRKEVLELIVKDMNLVRPGTTGKSPVPSIYLKCSITKSFRFSNHH
jgi:hypothetical protein